MGNISWTKSWSSSDDGSILDGDDLKNIQDDIVAVINGAITNVNINAAAAIAESKIAFDTSAGHDHDGTDSKTMAIGNCSDVTITSIANGEVLTYNSSTEVFENTTPAMPTGGIVIWTTATAPTGFLLCDGDEISRSTYATLFAVIGETYGAGDGSSTFLIPDLRGRVAIGLDAGNVNLVAGDALAETGGEETHTLSAAEMPAHTHTLPTGAVGSTAWSMNDNVDAPGTTNSGSAGSSGAHENMPPYLTLNYIIKI